MVVAIFKGRRVRRNKKMLWSVRDGIKKRVFDFAFASRQKSKVGFFSPSSRGASQINFNEVGPVPRIWERTVSRLFSN